MDLPTLLLLAVSLSLDCFAVALAAGIGAGASRARQAARIGLAFGGFQAGMTILGYSAGRLVADLIGAVDHWIAFGLLVFIGGKMILESRKGEEREGISLDTASLLVLAVATSIDALAVGISLAFLDSGILVPALLIGVTAFAVSAAGALLGGRVRESFGETMELIGGIVLIAIGIRVLAEHLLG